MIEIYFEMYAKNNTVAFTENVMLKKESNGFIKSTISNFKDLRYIESIL